MFKEQLSLSSVHRKRGVQVIRFEEMQPWSTRQLHRQGESIHVLKNSYLYQVLLRSVLGVPSGPAPMTSGHPEIYIHLRTSDHSLPIFSGNLSALLYLVLNYLIVVHPVP